jgi:hypothetical protein
MKHEIIERHVSPIVHGDVIMVDDKMKTVSNTDIKSSPFMGISIFGDNYNLGYKPVKKVVIYRAIPAPCRTRTAWIEDSRDLPANYFNKQ